MTSGLVQVVLFFGVLAACVKPLGWYMARVLAGRPCGLDRVLGPIERATMRACGVPAGQEMGWRAYAGAILAFNTVGFAAVYGLQRLQHLLPANPQGFGAVSADSSFNTAVSFVTNTNWQGYGGETTMSYLTQMLGLAVQNFLSAATGIAVLAALIRGLSRRSASTVGSAWLDLNRAVLYILLPLSIVLATVLVSQGVVQNFGAYRSVALTRPLRYEEPAPADAKDAPAPAAKMVTEQMIPMGPAASQVAIKMLGINGGGFFNANAAHPLENPTPLSNFLQMLAILLIPASLCWTYGEMVGDRRQGWALLAAMTLMLAAMFALCWWAEQSGNPRLTALGVDQASSGLQGGGNMEGKEVRFGVANSALFATATTAASCGAVNGMHDSFTPLGGLAPLWLIQLGEVVFGGTGTGLYGMLMFVIVAVFAAGLMVGRTPEYLGKKIEPFEMKMASLAVLIPCGLILLGTAAGVAGAWGTAGTSNPGPHGFTQILYAFTSATGNNGSAFAGLGANTPFYNLALGVCMYLGRFWTIIPVLALAGSLAGKRAVPTTSGTLPTHNAVFVLMLIAVVVIVGALTFVPALALGPIVEHLRLHAP